ncbi:hypothetical protein EK904_014293 [Melospiza melodia maxima]|nr:hypothetical protein EK904_014293 [Melospiza melodia maxima]
MAGPNMPVQRWNGRTSHRKCLQTQFYPSKEKILQQCTEVLIPTLKRVTIMPVLLSTEGQPHAHQCRTQKTLWVSPTGTARHSRLSNRHMTPLKALQRAHHITQGCLKRSPSLAFAEGPPQTNLHNTGPHQTGFADRRGREICFHAEGQGSSMISSSHNTFLLAFLLAANQTSGQTPSGFRKGFHNAEITH